MTFPVFLSKQPICFLQSSYYTVTILLIFVYFLPCPTRKEGTQGQGPYFSCSQKYVLQLAQCLVNHHHDDDYLRYRAVNLLRALCMGNLIRYYTEGDRCMFVKYMNGFLLKIWHIIWTSYLSDLLKFNWFSLMA